jgi:LysM repeat protein
MVYPDDERIVSSMQAVQHLSRRVTNYIEYIVQPGDNLHIVAQRFDTTISTIARDNNIPSTAHLIIDQRLMIRVFEPAISVRMSDAVTRIEPIPMPIEQRENNSLHHAQTNIIEHGRDGSREAVWHIIRVNNVFYEEVLYSYRVIDHPVTHVIEIGTNPGEIER